MPLIHARYVSIIKFWLKLLHSKPEKYINIIYKTLYQDVQVNHNRKNWCSLLRDTLFNLGFADACISQTVGDSKLFLLLIKQRVKDHFYKVGEFWTIQIVPHFTDLYPISVFSPTCILIYCMFRNLKKKSVLSSCFISWTLR